MRRQWSGLLRRRRDVSAVVLDDYFPTLLTGFRVAEYNSYLEAWPRLAVLSTLGSFAEEHDRYASRYPALAPRVRRYTPRLLRSARFAYLNFLNNANAFLPALESQRLPFALTLYPGGGFGLDEEASDLKLHRVLSSPGLRALTVTQPVTDSYVRAFAGKHGLPLPDIHHIPGVVANDMYFGAALPAHGPWFGEGKDILDLCFVAEKYMPHGENKGYPEFIAMAHRLRDEPAVRFHVVGSFDAGDLDVTALGERIRFHGRIETPDLPAFFSTMDVVVSPNRPFTLHEGNFDGFPTGACVEASLCGVALLVSDELRQDPGYAAQGAALVVPPDAELLAGAVRDLVAAPSQLGPLARRGQAATRGWYSPDVQVGRRMKILEDVARQADAVLV